MSSHASGSASSVDDISSTETGAEAETTEITEGETAVEVDPDRLFDVLKNQRRRRTLRYLTESDGAVTIGGLAEHIAALENDTTPGALTTSERKRVYVGLYQCHLPKMDDVDAIDFDKARGTVTRGANVSAFTPYLDLDGEQSHDWSRYYLLFAGIAALLFVAGSVGTMGLTQPMVIAGTIGAFSVLSLVHLHCVSGRVSGVIAALVED